MFHFLASSLVPQLRRWATNLTFSLLFFAPRMSQELANLAYELPIVVKSIKDGWHSSLQVAALVSSLLTISAVAMLSVINGDDSSRAKASGGQKGALVNFLYISSYSSIIFNISAALTSLILIDRLSALPWHAARKENYNLMEVSSKMPNLALLQRFGLKASWRLIVLHWFSTFVIGVYSLVLQVMVYVWISQTPTVKWTMFAAVIVTGFPFFLMSLLVDLLGTAWVFMNSTR